MKKILIDVSLTGGRGPAKKVWEFIQDCKANNISYVILTDKQFVQKLEELGISPSYIIDTSKNEKPKVVIQKFYETIKNIDYDLMVKFGARIAGPIASRKLGKPYILIDGGLPDFLTEDESLYERKTFEQAKKIYITTQFDWTLPSKTGLENVESVCYPLSRKTFKWAKDINNKKKKELLEQVSKTLKGNLSKAKKEILINLVMTGDYIGNPEERVTYGGWLTAKQYDQCIGFVRRLVTDLGESKQDISIFMDTDIAETVQDLLNKYPNVNLLTFKNGWDFQVEILMKAAADCTISRATNYQPYIALFEKGCNVTTPVPANGYMDEDTAGDQYADKGLTTLIPYDNEQYVEKLFEFIGNEKEQKDIEKNLKKNKKFMRERNANQLILDYLENV